MRCFLSSPFRSLRLGRGFFRQEYETGALDEANAAVALCPAQRCGKWFTILQEGVHPDLGDSGKKFLAVGSEQRE